MSEPSVLRRRMVRGAVQYLRSDLYERNRSYADSPFETAPVEYDHEHSMLWGSPLGWRVLITVHPGEEISLIAYKPNGQEWRRSPMFTVADDYNQGTVEGWLEDNLP